MLLGHAHAGFGRSREGPGHRQADHIFGDNCRQFRAVEVRVVGWDGDDALRVRDAKLSSGNTKRRSGWRTAQCTGYNVDTKYASHLEIEDDDW